MKVWVFWTHWDCEVEVSLRATQGECFAMLKEWLDDCDDNCDHNPDEDMSFQEIASAIEWHYEELGWSIEERDVPEPVIEPVLVQPDSTELPATPSDVLQRFTDFAKGTS